MQSARSSGRALSIHILPCSPWTHRKATVIDTFACSSIPAILPGLHANRRSSPMTPKALHPKRGTKMINSAESPRTLRALSLSLPASSHSRCLLNLAFHGISGTFRFTWSTITHRVCSNNVTCDAKIPSAVRYVEGRSCDAIGSILARTASPEMCRVSEKDNCLRPPQCHQSWEMLATVRSWIDFHVWKIW